MAKWWHWITQCYRDIQGADRISRPTQFKIRTKMNKAAYMTYLYIFIMSSHLSTILESGIPPLRWVDCTNTTVYSVRVARWCQGLRTSELHGVSLATSKTPSILTSPFSSSKSQRFPVFGGIFEFWGNIWVADASPILWAFTDLSQRFLTILTIKYDPIFDLPHSGSVG